MHSAPPACTQPQLRAGARSAAPAAPRAGTLPRIASRAAAVRASADADVAVSRRAALLLPAAASLLPALSPPLAFADAPVDPAAGAGRVVLVTGANSGIGYETALGMAARGFDTVVACRTVDKGRGAAARIASAVPGAKVRVLDAPLELADLRSVAAYAEAFKAAGLPLHLLINNAGIMAAPLGATADGHELHHGVNHLGHFALTTALLPALRGAGTGARIVHVSSIASYGAGFDVADLDWRARPYERWSAYCASKRENVLFSDALAAREAAAGTGVSSVALHPGIVDTELVRYLVPEDWLASRAAANGDRSELAVTAAHLLGVRSAPEGAAPSLWAATAPGGAVASGEFYLDVAQPAPGWGRPGGGAGGRALGEALWERSEAAVADALAGGRVRVALAA